MRRIMFIGILAILALNACIPKTQPAMDEPVNNETPAAPQTGDFIPSPADSNLMRGEVYLDSTDLLTLESFPLQFMLTLKGSLPTPCHEVRIEVSPPDADKKVVVDVYSVSNPDEMCAQVLEPFEINFPLGSFPAGHYTVWVNGKKVAELDS